MKPPRPPSAKTRRGAGRVAFLAHQATFATLLAAGHSQQSIYDDHATRLRISYSQFSRYVGKYLAPRFIDAPSPRHVPAPTHQSQFQSQRSPTEPLHRPGLPANRAAGSIGRNFQHNPRGGQARDDLV